MKEFYKNSLKVFYLSGLDPCDYSGPLSSGANQSLIPGPGSHYPLTYFYTS